MNDERTVWKKVERAHFSISTIPCDWIEIGKLSLTATN